MERFKLDTTAEFTKELVKYAIYYLNYRGLSVDCIEEHYEDISKSFKEETGVDFLILDDSKDWFIEQVVRVSQGGYITY